MGRHRIVDVGPAAFAAFPDEVAVAVPHRRQLRTRKLLADRGLVGVVPADPAEGLLLDVNEVFGDGYAGRRRIDVDAVRHDRRGHVLAFAVVRIRVVPNLQDAGAPNNAVDNGQGNLVLHIVFVPIPFANLAKQVRAIFGARNERLDVDTRLVVHHDRLHEMDDGPDLIDRDARFPPRIARGPQVAVVGVPGFVKRLEGATCVYAVREHREAIAGRVEFPLLLLG